jgi:hypothetical protein
MKADIRDSKIRTQAMRSVLRQWKGRKERKGHWGSLRAHNRVLCRRFKNERIEEE